MTRTGGSLEVHWGIVARGLQAVFVASAGLRFPGQRECQIRGDQARRGDPGAARRRKAQAVMMLWMGGKSISHHEMTPWLKPDLVGIYKGIIRTRISWVVQNFVHPRYGAGGGTVGSNSRNQGRGQVGRGEEGEGGGRGGGGKGNLWVEVKHPTWPLSRN